MIGRPHNDFACLGALTDNLQTAVDTQMPELMAEAARYQTIDELIAAIRAKPQRDDEGLPCDGPKVDACSPPQRFRWFSPMPNCFERGGEFVAVAEVIDPSRVYRLATVKTPNGLHTFPTMDGEPVVLDPGVTRNALRDGLYRIARNSALKSPGLPPDVATRRLRIERLIGTDETKGVRGDLARARKAKAAGHTTWVDGRPIDDAIASYEKALANFQRTLDELPRNTGCARPVILLTPTDAIDWIGDLVAVPSERYADGPTRARNAHRAMRAVLVGRPLCVADIRDVAFVLALADREASLQGPSGSRIVRTSAYALDALDRENARRWATRNARRNLRIGRYNVEPNIPLLASLGRVGGRLGARIGVEAVKAKLAALGVSPPILNTLELELNREGLSLGPFAKPPPMLGSLGALTPEALAGRWLAMQL